MAVRKTPAKKAPAKKAPAKKAPAKKAPVAKKAPAKKTPVKKAAVKATPARQAPAKAAPKKKTTAISERYTKTQIVTEIAENTELSKQQVNAVLDELGDLIERHIKKRACGEFVLPGMMKISTVKKPARKARKGVNPFTGEEMMFKAKPASTTIKVRPLKKMKDMVE